VDSLFSGEKGRTLLLGSNGLLGSFFQVYLQGIGHNPTYSKVDFSSKDISTFQEYILDTKPNTILNCAGMVDISKCEENPELAYYLNSTVPKILAKLARSTNAKFVHISSPSVFTRGSMNHKENGKTSTVNSVYGLSKALGEKNVLQSNNKALICRLNFFSLSDQKRTFFGDLIDALQNGKPFDAFSDVFFNPIFGGDIPLIVSQLLNNESSGIYHVVGSECISKLDFSKLTEQLMGLQSSQIRGVTSSGEFSTGLRSQNTCLSNEKLKSEGVAVPTIARSVKNSLAFYKVT
jgi:dTDP-4-dehydrorhamnose reductase